MWIPAKAGMTNKPESGLMQSSGVVDFYQRPLALC